MTPQQSRAIAHAAAVRMVKFDRQAPEVREILRNALVDVWIPAAGLTARQARARAGAGWNPAVSIARKRAGRPGAR